MIEKEEQTIVSIVIVCMNNLKNLYPCLDSIRKFTTVNYETFVVAYLFSPENLIKVKRDYPWVKFIESNEIRGFSENNNLALRQANGKFCFVLNDDTFHDEPVIDRLVKDYESMAENVAVISPNVYRPNGTVQHCGRPRISMLDDMLDAFGYIKHKERNSRYCNKSGIFQSYNVHGAAFMIKREIFEKIGWFDERYFFCPEDIALSTLLNNLNYKCMVDANAKLVHIGGGTWSKTLVATKPATVRGNVIFYCGEKFIKKLIYRLYWSLIYVLYILYWIMRVQNKEKRKIMICANWHAVIALWSSQTPKELFANYYKR